MDVMGVTIQWDQWNFIDVHHLSLIWREIFKSCYKDEAILNFFNDGMMFSVQAGTHI